MTKDEYAIAGYLGFAVLALLVAFFSAMTMATFGASMPEGAATAVSLVALWSAGLAALSMGLMVFHMLAMVIFNGAVLHDFGVQRGWWED